MTRKLTFCRASPSGNVCAIAARRWRTGFRLGPPMAAIAGVSMALWLLDSSLPSCCLSAVADCSDRRAPCLFAAAAQPLDLVDVSFGFLVWRHAAICLDFASPAL